MLYSEWTSYEIDEVFRLKKSSLLLNFEEINQYQ